MYGQFLHAAMYQICVFVDILLSRGERTGLVVRASVSRSGVPGRCVVFLSKRHLLPKSTGNTQE